MIRIALALALILVSMFPAYSVGAAEARSRRNVEIEWEAVDGATLYEVRITRKESENQKPVTFKMREPKWIANIKPGLYLMQIRSFDDRGVPGSWSPPSELQVRLPSVELSRPSAGETIKAQSESSERIILTWDPVPGAEKYKVHVRSANGQWQEEHEVSDPKWEVKVPVGQKLEWTVTAVDGKGELGESNAQPVQFTIHGPPLPPPAINPPLSKYVREVEWKPQPNAKSYSYQIEYQEPERKTWRKVEAKRNVASNKVPLNIARPSGRYRLKVQAHGENRDSSPTQVLEFETRGGFRDPASLDRAILRDSIDKPTNFYAIASYLITSINYTADNYDTSQRPSFEAIGGTGRVGLGYQHPDSVWGGFGIVDMSGFTISGQNFTFAAAEGHVTHRLELGQGGLLLGGFGVYYKELPMVKGSRFDGFGGMGKVKTIGPHGGFTYWLPLTDRYGLQINARAYYTLTGGSSLGGKAKSSLSYQYGLLGSYRLAPKWMGYAGYAFRKDNALYSASDDPQNFGDSGKTSSIDIQGHYLNLILEFSF